MSLPNSRAGGEPAWGGAPGRPRLFVRPSRAVTAFTLLAAMTPSPARADAPAVAPESTEGRAEQLFSSGERKFDAGDYAGACADFSESLKLGPQLGTLLNLALCHEMTGKIVTAWHEYSHAAAWAAQNGQRDRLEFATRHVRGLEPKLPRVVLQLPPERAIAALELDGEPLPEERWYLPLFLDPGEHRIAVTAPGKRRTSIAFRVTSSPSDQLVYVPPLADEPVAERPVKPEPRPKADPTRRTLGWIGLGTGGAGLALGGTFGVLAMTTDERDPAVKTDATIATIGLASGAVVGGAGLWLLLSGKSEATAVSIAPQRGGLGLSATRAF